MSNQNKSIIEQNQVELALISLQNQKNELLK